MNKPLLSALMRKVRRDRAREDIEYFASYYLPHFMENNVPPFHREMRKYLMVENRLVIAAPRGFAKSTNLQIIYALWCLLFRKGDDILTISQSSQMAEDWIRKLKFELEGNQRIKDDFNPLLQWGEKDSKRWTSEHIVIQQNGNIFSQIRARGRGCQVRGLRPTRVFCDDLEDDELVRSEEQRKILKDWFLSALLNVLKFDQQLVVIGTVLHPLALLAEILQKKEGFEKWFSKKYVALIDDKTSLWSDRFPVEDLLRRKQEIGTRLFEQEFQNNPIASENCLWDPNWIKNYNGNPKIKEKFVALDPAATEKQSADYSAMVCMGVGEDGNIYEVDSLRGRWGTWDLIDNIILFYMKHKPIRFGIEEVAFQSFIKPVLIKEAAKKGIRIPVESIKLGSYSDKEKRSPRDKYTRALSVVHYWEQGLVYLKNQDLIDEIAVFPTGVHDDLVDACVWCVKMIMKHNPTAVIMKKDVKQEKGIEVKDGVMENPYAELFQNKPRGISSWRIGA